MRRSLLLCCVFIATASAGGPLPRANPVQDKNFYLLTQFEQSGEVSKALQQDKTLSQLNGEKHAALAKAAKSCGVVLACYANAMKWPEAESARAADALRALYRQSPPVRQLVDGRLRSSGFFFRYQAKPGGELLAQAWTDAVQGLNRIIDVYALGLPPRYPAIDSVSYDVKAETYGRLVQIIAQVLDDESSGMPLFFEPSLRFALALLDANHRDEAGRFEPLANGENAAAIRRARTLNWSRFPYSAIVVPGSGTDRESIALSAWGKLRLRIAVRRYRDGKAPFILVSGGFVHPNQTAHCEAMEMKRSLMADFGIPAEAILVDPHARHTTTNLRNAVRELYRYGFPSSKPSLISTDPSQSVYIEGDSFRQRCLKELGYLPVRDLKRISPFDLSFASNLESLQMDAADPLDP